MRIISLLASPHGEEGNTAALLDLVVEGARNEGAEAETIILPGGTVGPCKACDVCHKQGACPHKDDFESIKGKVYEADGILLASPNYIFNVSAQMKAFMDRCAGVIHCMSFGGRYGASVVTSGGGGEEPICEYMNRFLTITGITPVGSVWATMGAIQDGSFPEEIQDQARGLGKKLVESCESKAAFPEIKKAQDEFKERMRMLIMYRKEEWPYEYEYWQKHYGME
ncbi:MAG: flavodoxin family protein [Candidatus Abyssubacteria bacterium]|nr:flavodoxin family protein [Candidatus Abyssubacteria bacterium]